MFGAFTVFLAAVGLYGIIAYSISRRTREIGVRVALGATPRGIVKQIVLEGSKMIGTGVVFGVIGAAAVSRLIQALLYGISSIDWISFFAGTTILALVALAANVIPAVAASRIDPIEALRSE
jgi:putative ABC transport system permease protein